MTDLATAGLEAENAAIESERAHLAADDAARESKEAAAQAKKAREAATDLDKKAVPLEDTAAAKEGEAEAAEKSCGSAKSGEQIAQGDVDRAKAEQTRVQQLNPGECNPDTEAADAKLAAAEGRLAAARGRRQEACDKAADARRDANAARTDAENARKAANDADTKADLEEQIAADVEGHAEDLRLKAVQAAELASVKAAQLEAVKNDLAAVGTASTSTTPKHPNMGDAASLNSCPPAPPTGPGIHSATDGNFTAALLNKGFFFYGGDDYEKVEGKLVELTEGHSITHTLAADVSIVVGGRLDETFGLEFKVDMKDDTRFVFGSRWERNVGIKVEHVRGVVDETVLGSRSDHNPTFYFGKNPTKRAECDKKLQHKATQVIDEHKAKFEEFRRKMKVDYKLQKQTLDSINSRITEYNANLAKVEEEVKKLEAKVDDLKTQAKNFAMNSDAFIKFMVDGSASIEAGRFKGNGAQKFDIVCDAIAELQASEIKWA